MVKRKIDTIDIILLSLGFVFILYFIINSVSAPVGQTVYAVTGQYGVEGTLTGASTDLVSFTYESHVQGVGDWFKFSVVPLQLTGAEYITSTIELNGQKYVNKVGALDVWSSKVVYFNFKDIKKGTYTIRITNVWEDGSQILTRNIVVG